MWARPRKLRNGHFVCKIYNNRQKNDFYVKNRKNMRFSWDFLQNMLENGHSNLQTNLWENITSNIFKISNSKNHGIAPTPPPHLPTLKAYPTSGVGGRFGIFSLKWMERMNLKVPGTILPLGCAILSSRAKTVRGLVQNPLRRTRVNILYKSLVQPIFDYCNISWYGHFNDDIAKLNVLQKRCARIILGVNIYTSSDLMF